MEPKVRGIDRWPGGLVECFELSNRFMVAARPPPTNAAFSLTSALSRLYPVGKYDHDTELTFERLSVNQGRNMGERRLLLHRYCSMLDHSGLEVH